MGASFDAVNLRPRGRLDLRTILATITVLALLAIECVFVARHHNFMGDFLAPYAAGRAVLHGLNPYSSAPAPVPGYVLAIYAPLALLPYPAAGAAWFAVLLLVSAGAVVALARLLDRPVYGVIALLGLGLAFAPIPIGAVPPVALFAVVLAALRLRDEKIWMVAAMLGVAAVLPHLALAAIISVFLYVPRARIPLIIVVAGLAILDVSFGGPGIALYYFTQVLPQAAHAEVGYVMQYSLTWVAQAFGASSTLAVALGNVSYLGMLLLGLWCAGRLWRRFRDPAFLVLIPPAFVVIGGSYIHFADILLALPAAALLWKNAVRRTRSILVVAAILLAFPWLWITQEWFAFAFAAATVAMCVWLFDLPVRTAFWIGLLPVIICVGLLIAGALYGPQLPAHGMTVPPHSIADETAWAALVRSSLTSGGAFWLAVKIPTWIGLLIFACCSVFEASCVPHAETAPA